MKKKINNLIRKINSEKFYKKKSMIICVLLLSIICIVFSSYEYKLNSLYDVKVEELHSLGGNKYDSENLIIRPKTIADLEFTIDEQIKINEINKKAEEERLAKIVADKKAEEEKLAKIEADKKEEERLAQIKADNMLQEEQGVQQEQEEALAYEDTSPSDSRAEDVGYSDVSSNNGNTNSDNSYTPPPASSKTCEDYGYYTSFDVAYNKAEIGANANYAAGYGTELAYPLGDLECHRGYYYMEHEDDMVQSKRIYV